ncbi:uncharacterized protein LOC135824568 [Sycon ciliatum]
MVMAAKGKKGRPKKCVKKGEEAAFTVWFSGQEDGLKDEFPHMSASALREEAERRWGALPADDKENLTAEAKAAAKAKAGAVFGRKAPRTSTANGDPGPAAAAVLSSSPSPLVTDSLEDNIVENSLDATPLLDSVNAANASGDNVSAVTSIGLLDDRTCLSPPVKRSRGARFIDSDDDEVDDAVENGGSAAAAAATEQAAPAAKRAKLPEASTANIVAQSTKASAQKLANFAFAK